MAAPAASLAGKRVLLTGASGFVGRQLAPRLEAAGARVIAPVGPEHPGGLDLSDAAAVAALVADGQPDIVLHLAALSSVGDALGNPLAVWDNVRATDALVTALLAGERPCRFVFASTSEVYGASFNDGPVDEDSPLRPLNAYARSKVACEYLLRDAASDRFEVVALRLFNHTGPGQDTRFVLPSFAAQIAAIEAGRSPGPLRHGNLDVVRDFSDVADVLDAYLAVAADPTPQPGFQIFNVGSGEALSLKGLLADLVAHAATAIALEPDPARMRPSDVPVASGRVGRFAARYGIRPTRRLNRTLHDLLAYQRDRLRQEGA